MTSEPSPGNRWRRWRLTAGLLLMCLGPPLLLVLSLAYGRYRPRPSDAHHIAWMIMAALVGFLNAWLTFVRPALYRVLHGSMEGYRFVSVIPVVGTFIVFGVGLVGFGEVATALAGLLVLLVDTGGTPWLLPFIWKEPTFWEP